MEISPLLIPLFALAIPIVAILSVPLRRWLDIKERMAAQANIDAIEKAAQYAAKTERLEQRVAVLERILTDRSASLAHEIERLRDQPLN